MLIVLSGPVGVGKSTVARAVAATFERSVLLPADDFGRFVVNGSPYEPVVGVALGAAALEWADDGYVVVVEGHAFPDGIDGLAAWCERRDVTLRVVFLRADLATCLARARARGPVPDDGSVEALHARFDDLGAYERCVVDAGGPVDDVVAAVLARC